MITQGTMWSNLIILLPPLFYQYLSFSQCSKHGRRVLFQICWGCIRTNAPDNDFKDYYMRQVARGKVRIKALVSTMGKLAEIIYHCLRSGESYEYQGIYRRNRVSANKNVSSDNLLHIRPKERLLSIEVDNYGN